MNIKINIIEAASELAQNELESFYQGQIYIDDNDIESIYTEEAQNVFNELYDKYFNILYDLQEPVNISIG